MTDVAPAPAGVEHLRKVLAERRAPLRELVRRLRSEGGVSPDQIGLALGRAHAAVLDELVREAFGVALVGDEGAELALAGVGGYGRGAVALGADLDLRLLASDMGRAQSVIEALLYPLWDAGLSVDHQVVTIEDLLAAARDDLPSATSLLDWRYVAGDRGLSDRLMQRAAEGLFAVSELPALMDRLEQEVARRHQRFGGSVYMLEPDVKNGRGALRDLDAAWWVARARWKVNDFADLVGIGVLVPRQLRALEKARDLLWRIRNLLHESAGRRSDRLGFDEQDVVAGALGYRQRSDDPHTAMAQAVERLMSDYYRAARTITRFRELVVGKAQPLLKRRRPSHEAFGGGIELFDGEVTFSRDSDLDSEPAIALRIVSRAVERHVPLRATARTRIVDACGDDAWCERLRDSDEAAALFVELVTHRALTALKRGSVMRELHDLGLLLAMVPEFAPLVGRVHHDTYHVYTVDVHSVAAVDRLGEIIRGDIVIDDSEGDRWVGSLACRLASDVTSPHILFFATLLHDVGKAIGRRDHSERGATMARDILGRLGFSEEDIDEVSRLIEHHLTMYLTATRRDLDDPGTAAELARVVRDSRGLTNLYLLTVADLSTTSPTSMTSWKARMLDELYVATQAHLHGSQADTASLTEHLEAVVAKLPDGPDGALAEVARRFVPAMPERYLLASAPDVVASHVTLVAAQLQKGRGATVDLMPDPRFGAAEICVITADRPGTLAAIAAALTAGRLMVHAAQIYSCRLPSEVASGGEARDVQLAVDVFWVHHRHGAEAIPAALAQVGRNLDAVIDGESSAAALVASHSTARPGSQRGEPPVTDRVIIDQRASPDHTVVEVLTRDRRGLLFALSEAIHRQGLSIAVAKLATEGTRVVDVFYVSEPDGKKVTIEHHVEALERALLDAIDGLDRAS